MPNLDFSPNSSTGSTSARRYPLSLVFSGDYYWSGGNLNYQGSYGDWWSTTAASSTNAYGLDVYYTSLNPQVSTNKRSGYALRCVNL